MIWPLKIGKVAESLKESSVGVVDKTNFDYARMKEDDQKEFDEHMIQHNIKNKKLGD